ncbi:MAG: phosphoribosylamine--glycine ligase [Candidatus Binatia bacterium]
MRVLVVGSGGREHALCWKIRQSPRVRELWCAPGNGGIAADAECVPIAAEDVAGIRKFARERKIDLAVVGPELPLTLGIVDEFEREGLRAFGPGREAARLEGSKAFTKALLQECGVPTAGYGEFTDADEAAAYVRRKGAPIVVKADGLAAGKGVFVCATEREAIDAIDSTLRGKIFGEAGARVVVEDFLEGEEASFLALTDGETVLPLASSQDHKRVLDDDQGPNTGGMGAYSPAPVLTPEIGERVMKEIMAPVVEGLRRRGVRYRGVLYAGLMIRDGRPAVLEFNVRFGDPECQALLVRLDADLVDLMEAVVDGRLRERTLRWSPRSAVCVVLAAKGYPGKVAKGDEIRGLEALAGLEDVVVFHAGTERRGGRLVTAGGRVLGVTALGESVRAAVERAYAAVAKISWDGMHYRRDIGRRAIG